MTTEHNSSSHSPGGSAVPFSQKEWCDERAPDVKLRLALDHATMSITLDATFPHGRFYSETVCVLTEGTTTAISMNDIEDVIDRVVAISKLGHSDVPESTTSGIAIGNTFIRGIDKMTPYNGGTGPGGVDVFCNFPNSFYITHGPGGSGTEIWDGYSGTGISAKSVSLGPKSHTDDGVDAPVNL